MSERKLAAEAVAAVLAGASLSEVLPPRLAGLEDRERALVQELVYGTVRWYPQLAFCLDRLLERRPKETGVFALLAVGLYQLRFTRIPAHAAVSETVAVAQKPLRGLCNAVLRNAQRRHDELTEAVAANPVAASAHPLWLLAALQSDWPEDWPEIVSANNRPAPMTLRVNRLKSERDGYLELLAQAGIDARPTRHSPDGIVLASAQPVGRLPGFESGWVSVQDESAQLAVDVLAAAPGMRVLDACAAPGGKTCHLRERTPDLAALVAVESDATRARRIDENLARLGLEATVVVADATRPADWWDGVLFDRILLDAPCSATGVIRRHPDIRLLRRADDIPALAARQRHLLDALFPLLAPGGQLVYATCSVLKAENDGVLAGTAAHPPAASWGLPTAHGRQLLPGRDDSDGFYYACLLEESG